MGEARPGRYNQRGKGTIAGKAYLEVARALVDHWYFPGAFLLRLGAALFVLYLAYYFLLARRADFTIRLQKGKVTYRGKLASAQQPAIAEFLLQDLGLHGPLKICGRRDKGRLQLWFRGRLSVGDKQRIRNFLVAG